MALQDQSYTTNPIRTEIASCRRNRPRFYTLAKNIYYSRVVPLPAAISSGARVFVFLATSLRRRRRRRCHRLGRSWVDRPPTTRRRHGRYQPSLDIIIISIIIVITFYYIFLLVRPRPFSRCRHRRWRVHRWKTQGCPVVEPPYHCNRRGSPLTNW